MRTAFIGLDVTDYPMAGHVARTGRHVAAYRRAREKVEQRQTEDSGRSLATQTEGLNFARAIGLDPQAFVDVISIGVTQSRQRDNRQKTMLAGQYEHGFAVEWMKKDPGICFEERTRSGAALSAERQVNGFYAEIEVLGGCRWDTSGLLTRFEAKGKGTA